jgi:capsular polysaccharide biosynthesis protein
LAAIAKAEYNFELIDPSVMTFSEQVRTFSEAEAIVGAEGAGMANLAFCSEGSKAYFFGAKKHAFTGWQSIAAAVGCDATTLVASVPQKLYTIHPGALRSALHGYAK